MPIKLNSLDQIRSVEWGRSYLWDVYFEAPQSGILSDIARIGKDMIGNLIGSIETAIPTQGELLTPTWFPITQFSYISTSVVNKTIEGTYRQSSIPIGNRERTMSITFIDDIDHTMYNWASMWFNPFSKTVDGNETCLKFRNEMCRSVYITKLYNDLTPINSSNSTEAFNVVPDGDVVFKGTSEDGLNTYTINFKIINIINMENKVLGTTGALLKKAGKVLQKKAVGALRYGTKDLGR